MTTEQKARAAYVRAKSEAKRVRRDPRRAARAERNVRVAYEAWIGARAETIGRSRASV